MLLATHCTIVVQQAQLAQVVQSVQVVQVHVIILLKTLTLTLTLFKEAIWTKTKWCVDLKKKSTSDSCSGA